MSVLDSLVIDRTHNDVVAKNEKGTYNAEDLNRVEEAVRYISDTLAEYGYCLKLYPAKQWEVNAIPRISEIEEYFAKLKELKNISTLPNVSPDIPLFVSQLNYAGANNIELFLKNIGEICRNIPETWYYAGDVFSGTAVWVSGSVKKEEEAIYAILDEAILDEAILG